MTTRINIFALRPDLIGLLENLEAKKQVKYTLADSSSTPQLQEWLLGRELPALGTANGSQTSSCASYLITEPSLTVLSRKVAQASLEQRFDVDQLSNPDSIVFTPAGEWEGGVILAGNLATNSESPVAKSIMKAAGSAVRKTFTKVRGFWVGPEALVALRNGRRLTIAEQSPASFDLREEMP